MTNETSTKTSDKTILETLGEKVSPKEERTTTRKEKINEDTLPQNLSDDQLRNARHAATFPPNTPHSVINAFADPVDDMVTYADPRKAPKVVDPLNERLGIGVTPPKKETKAAKTKRVAAEKKQAAEDKVSDKAALEAAESK